MGKLRVVVGGQFGSEGKGAVAGYLATDPTPGPGLVAVRVAGPNAGHTVVSPAGVTFKLQQLPVAAVTNPGAELVIAAGSEIDLDILDREISILDDAGFDVSSRLRVDPEATVIELHHSTTELGGKEHGAGGLAQRIGSTGKGVGAARAARAMREAERYGMHRKAAAFTAPYLFERIRSGYDVLIEGTQGFGLGTHGGAYPFVTSSDCRAIDFLSMAGVSPWQPGITLLEVWVVCRTYPIRVAGNSGPLRSEISWSQLADMTDGYIKEERTTVTNKVRRIAQFDTEFVAAAIKANGGVSATRVALTMFDYWYPELAGVIDPERVKGRYAQRVLDLAEALGHARIALLGTGPSSIIDLR